MNRYDKDMMHERELIYDAKGQLHKADKAYKKGDKSKKKEMIHDRELIHDAKDDIHHEDQDKHYAMMDRASSGHHEHGHHASANKVHKHSRHNNPTSKREHFDSSTDEGIATLYTGKREGMS
tara:strand:+ start:8316 stop:8681 length:366 start_codon:yes stop_codon:yes gene_type:complete